MNEQNVIVGFDELATFRNVFAASAMQRLLAKGEMKNPEEVAIASFEYADAMVDQCYLNRRKHKKPTQLKTNGEG